MEAQLSKLIDKAWDRYIQTPPDRRLLIAIGGIPGSGKTTLALSVVQALNARHAAACAASAASPSSSSPPPVAAYVPMDGYHLTRAQLSAMPDPATAHFRRGAEFTFDGASFLSLVQSLRQPLVPAVPAAAAAASDRQQEGVQTIYAPSFDHAIKDPVEGAIPILPSHRVVVLEGLYVLLDREPWRTAAGLVDERWFVRVDFEVARRRLAKRHVRAGIVEDEEAGDRRARENDLVNGAMVEELLLPVEEVVVSREDGGWVHD